MTPDRETTVAREPAPSLRRAWAHGAAALCLGAAAMAQAAEAGPASTGSLPDSAFQPTCITGSDVHKYLGLGTVVLLGLTAATSPHGKEDCGATCGTRQTSGTVHTRLARTTAVMAGATVGTGLVVHWDDFHLRDGFSDPDNQHVMLGLVGSGLLLYAVHKSMHSSVPTQHAGFAELGGAAMAVAIKLTW